MTYSVTSANENFPSDYGVRVQIKALQGHPFIILEDSKNLHEIPAPDPTAFESSETSDSENQDESSSQTGYSVDINPRPVTNPNSESRSHHSSGGYPQGGQRHYSQGNVNLPDADCTFTKIETGKILEERVKSPYEKVENRIESPYEDGNGHNVLSRPSETGTFFAIGSGKVSKRKDYFEIY